MKARTKNRGGLPMTKEFLGAACGLAEVIETHFQKLDRPRTPEEKEAGKAALKNALRGLSFAAKPTPDEKDIIQ